MTEWSKTLLRGTMGRDQLKLEMAFQETITKNEKHEGPQFLGQKTKRIISGPCFEVDALGAYPNCALALECEEDVDEEVVDEGGEGKGGGKGGDGKRRGALRNVKDIMRAFIALRESATKSGDRVLSKKFKMAANSFLGCMKHIFPRLRNRFVRLLKEEMARASEVISADPQLERIAVVSDSVIFTAAPKAPSLTDERARQVLDAINAACKCCTFEMDKRYANLVYLGKNVQFGCAAAAPETASDVAPVPVLQRGIIGRLQTKEAVGYLNGVMRRIATSGECEAPSAEDALRALGEIEDEALAKREKSDFNEKRKLLLRAIETLQVTGKGKKGCDGGGGDGGGNNISKKRTAIEVANGDDGGDGGEGEGEEGSERRAKAPKPDQADGIIMSEFRKLAEGWAVPLGETH